LCLIKLKLKVLSLLTAKPTIMKRFLAFIVVSSVSAMFFSSCQKENQTSLQSSPQAAPPGPLTVANQSTSKGYNPPFIYQVELSANIPGVQGGGVWLWIGLNPDGTGDYSGSDCGHGGLGAANDKGDVTWHLAGQNNQWLVINGLVLNGLDGFVTTITVPSAYGHYTGTIGSYLTLPGFIPPFVGTAQLQVAP
jgi:hypothetical protein